MSSPTVRTRRLPKSMSSVCTGTSVPLVGEDRGPGMEMDQVADGVQDVVIAEEPARRRCSPSSGRPNFWSSL